MFQPARRPLRSKPATAEGYVARVRRDAAHEVRMAIELVGDAVARMFGLAAELARHPSDATAAGAAQIAEAAATAARFLGSAAHAAGQGSAGVSAAYVRHALDVLGRSLERAEGWSTWSAYADHVVRARRALERAREQLGTLERALEREVLLARSLERARRARAA